MSTDAVFTTIYTYEAAIKILSRGFCLQKHTFLRDPWNWLDISVIALSYVTIVVELGPLRAIKTFRVFRALKTVAVVPGLKTIVSAIVYSVKNLKDVIILTVFMLAIFALMGLQLYMGVLGQKCVREYPTDPDELKIWGNISHQNYDFFMHNESNWWVDADGNYGLCGNSTGAGKCPDGFECMKGYGPNPNYGYTSFDHFFAAYLTAFRIMTQDYWENLYQITLQTAGPMNILFFLVNILFGSFYLVNLILAIVAMSYDTLQREAEEERARELEELEAIKEAEEAALAEAEAAAAEAAEALSGGFLGNDFDLGIDDNPVENKLKGRKDSLSNPVIVNLSKNLERGEDGMSSSMSTPPMIRRPPSQILPVNGEKPLSLLNYYEAEKHLPYADDSGQATPKSDWNGGLIIDSPIRNELARKLSLKSNNNSITPYDLSALKQNGQVVSTISSQSQMKMQPSPFEQWRSENGQGMNRNDVIVLNSIIDEVVARPASLYSHENNPYQVTNCLCKSNFSQKMIPQYEDDEGPKVKDIVMDCLKRGCDLLCIWDCTRIWIQCAEILSYLVFDPFTELFITVCTIVNIAFMALDSYDMEYDGM